jgi:starch synthase
MRPLRILEVSSEVAPFARTGGLGDVLGALPAALARQGHEVVVCMPKYKQVSSAGMKIIQLDWTVPIPVGDNQYDMTAGLSKNRRTKVTYCFIRNDRLFGRDELYRDLSTGNDYSDNDERFIFFARSVIEAIKKRDWKPDIVHCHDWQAALIPVYLESLYRNDPFFAGVKTVLTIHNLGYQGVFAAETFKKIGVSDELFYAVTGPLEFFGKVNFLKGGVVMADKISTVSHSYAQEIQSTDEFGAGLQDVLRSRSADLTGIVNGVDYTVWSPTRDKKVPYRYNLANLSGKKKTKIELINKAGLPVRDTTPLIGIISRLADQKGFDLIEEAADRLFAMDIQMILLGTGDEKYHVLFTDLEKKYPDKLKVYLTFDDSLAHWIEAGADMFLMPSRYEPCGLNQLYSLKYGTVPIVRKVGGLADTVVDFDPSTGNGTGFVFDDYSADAMLEAVGRAVDFFSHKRPWMKLMKAGMRQDFSWASSAVKYAELFDSLISP